MSNLNPLLETQALPPFSTIDITHMEVAITTLIERNWQHLERLLNQSDYSWENLIAPFEEGEDQLHNAWSPVSHLHSVMDNEQLRKVYNTCVLTLTQYETRLGQHKPLYIAYQKIKESSSYNQLSTAQQAAIKDALRDFLLSGIALPEDQQKRYAEIEHRLSELSTQFAENVLDATDAWVKLIVDEEQLKGIPESTISLAQEAATQKGLTGFLLTLDFPCYYAVITYAENKLLREEMYRAYSTRASDQAVTTPKFDNSKIMQEILSLRQEQAVLLGFNNYAECSLATKMANNTDQVLAFLDNLSAKSIAMAKHEFEELKQFARALDNVDTLQAWDVSYYSEKLQQHRYDFSQENIRPYFPINHVLNGLFEVIKRLFGVNFSEINDADIWHKDARLFSLEKNNNIVGYVYLDLYARAQKQGGAWMGDCRIRRRMLNNKIQLPVAYVVTNFSPATRNKPALLTHDEVTTLFHEFGHALHHLLTQIEVAAVSGINGVAWDAVELPSQFLENWCWQEETLLFLSSHYETGQPLPKALLQKMLAAKNFQAGMHMMRQIEFSLFDFLLHKEFVAGETDIQALLDRVRQKTAVYAVPEFNRFQHSFKHIFAGGYAAGYYSYKWAEVLSADAFSAFEEEGIFNPLTGQRFLDCILARGGAQEAMDLFKAFRGREPTVTALLRHAGITEENS